MNGLHYFNFLWLALRSGLYYNIISAMHYEGVSKSVTRWMTAASSLVQAGAEPVPAHNTGHCTRPARRPRIIVDMYI